MAGGFVLVVCFFCLWLLVSRVEEAFDYFFLGDSFLFVDISGNLVDVLAVTFTVVNGELEVGDDLEFCMLLHVATDITRRPLEEDECIVLTTIRDSSKKDRVLAVIRGHRDTRDGDEGIRIRFITYVRRYYLTDE